MRTTLTPWGRRYVDDARRADGRAPDCKECGNCEMIDQLTALTRDIEEGGDDFRLAATLVGVAETLARTSPCRRSSE